MIVSVLLILALICFLLALIEWPPPMSTPRLIAAGLFLWLLGTLIQSGMR